MASKAHSLSTRHKTSPAVPPKAVDRDLSRENPSPTFLDRKRKELIDFSMDLLGQSVDTFLERVAPAASARQQALGKRARAPHEHENDTDEDVGSSKQKAKRSVKKPRTKAKPEPVVEEGPKLACPYCVRFPERYGNVKTCMGPGWVKAHRVKEHLYRSHALPKNMCPRCFKAHETVAELKQHMRSKPACEVNESELDGFTPEQEKQLHERTNGRTEVEKWQEMYHILFPEDEMRPPYYHAIHLPGPNGAAVARVPPAFVDFEDCKAFVRREILRMMRPLVVKQVHELFQAMRQDMTVRVREIVKGVHAQLRRTWSFVTEEEDSSLSPPEQAPYQVVGQCQGQDEVAMDASQFEDLGELFKDEAIAQYFPPVEDGEGALFDVDAFWQNEFKDNLDISAAFAVDSGYSSTGGGMDYSAAGGDGIGASGFR